MLQSIQPSYLQIGFTIFTIVMALSVIFIRMKSSNRPVTVKKIIIPPLGMSTGLLMFVAPITHIPWLWGILAFAAGWFLFSYPLIRSTHFQSNEGQIYAKRSRSFMYVLLGMLAIRLALHQVVEHYVSIPQTGALFFLLAFGMIIRWRIYMLKEYQNIIQLQPQAE